MDSATMRVNTRYSAPIIVFSQACCYVLNRHPFSPDKYLCMKFPQFPSFVSPRILSMRQIFCSDRFEWDSTRKYFFGL
jgi:hypothetical protein